MYESLGLLYDYNKIKKCFKFAKNLNIYDDLTMTHYVKVYTKEIGIQELEIMLETVEEEVVTGNTIQSTFYNAFNGILTLIALTVSTFVAVLVFLIGKLIEMNKVEAFDILPISINATAVLVFFLIILISCYYFYKIHTYGERSKLCKVIKITKYIKNTAK